MNYDAKIPIVLSVVTLSFVVVKIVDIIVVDEIVSSPVVAMLPTGTTYYCKTEYQNVVLHKLYTY